MGRWHLWYGWPSGGMFATTELVRASVVSVAASFVLLYGKSHGGGAWP